MFVPRVFIEACSTTRGRGSRVATRFVSLARMLSTCAAMLAGIGGCASTEHDVLIPVDVAVPGASTVDMLVMTTRARSALPGQIFDGERSSSSTLTNVVISIPPDANRTVGDVQWPATLPPNPARDFATLRVSDMAHDRVDAWFGRVGTNGHKLLIFVHGFNTTYAEAVYRFAQIVHDTGTRAAPILFTWPSRGDLLQYAYDKESATASRDALEGLFTRAAADPNVTDVTVLAHSMGTWVTMEALRQMAIRRGHISAKIKNVILASADLDVDVFKSEFLDIPAPRPRFTLLVSGDDRALRLSRQVAGDVDRLGAIDPALEPYRSKLAAVDITAIDLTKVNSRDGVNHDKFAESPEVVRVIGTRLIEGQKIDAADPSFSEQVGQVVSRTADSMGGSGQSAGGRLREVEH